MSSERDIPMIPRYEYENAVMHYGKVNKRSMIMNITVCITFVILVAIFVVAYTIRERDRTAYERYLMNTIIEMRSDSTEVQEDGLHQ